MNIFDQITDLKIKLSVPDQIDTVRELSFERYTYCEYQLNRWFIDYADRGTGAKIEISLKVQDRVYSGSLVMALYTGFQKFRLDQYLTETLLVDIVPQVKLQRGALIIVPAHPTEAVMLVSRFPFGEPAAIPVVRRYNLTKMTWDQRVRLTNLLRGHRWTLSFKALNGEEHYIYCEPDAMVDNLVKRLKFFCEAKVVDHERIAGQLEALCATLDHYPEYTVLISKTLEDMVRYEPNDFSVLNQHTGLLVRLLLTLFQVDADRYGKETEWLTSFYNVFFGHAGWLDVQESKLKELRELYGKVKRTWAGETSTSSIRV